MPKPDSRDSISLPRRFHLGCGPLIAQGYVNIDESFPQASQTLAEGTVYGTTTPDTFILRYDLRKGIPANDNDLQTIYHAHFLEHLTDHDGKLLLADCYRCLAPGGTLRLAVPDFGLWCSNYVAGKAEFFDWYRRAYLNDDRTRYPTSAAVFMGMLYNWDHKMGYDWPSLSALLTQIGFANIRRAQWGISDSVINIASLENDPDRQAESLVVECSKPTR